jgi:hypothetical protein
MLNRHERSKCNDYKNYTENSALLISLALLQDYCKAKTSLIVPPLRQVPTQDLDSALQLH